MQTMLAVDGPNNGKRWMAAGKTDLHPSGGARSAAMPLFRPACASFDLGAHKAATLIAGK